ncbi:hypothetical protein [Bradyrhizobium canariense]|uniref:hypothetical protein n=1 Tax=Bradyrhizobium canariense TaxID=255045 RepID=UPI0018D4BDAB|nr:hypothetical protein [Bradyrhizobium canariense]
MIEQAARPAAMPMSAAPVVFVFAVFIFAVLAVSVPVSSSKIAVGEGPPAQEAAAAGLVV